MLLYSYNGAHMSQIFDLCITLNKPLDSGSPGAIASIDLRCDPLGQVRAGMLIDLLSKKERDDLRWYLEEYWKWPYLEFAARGRRVEALLIDVGKRLYHAVFGSNEAQVLVQKWREQADGQCQISIESELPIALSLPWELLQDEQGFLALRTDRPISIVRRLPQTDQTTLATSFEPPLRILLITSRPEGAGFVDPRSIARELLEEVQEHVDAGTIELEFLRPATLAALRARLEDTQRPIHILHFDGHGVFNQQKGQGLLAFEDEKGWLALVSGAELSQILSNRSVRLVVLTACQTAKSTAEDAFSSVATQLLQGGIDAVVAMSANFLVTSAIRYVETFYQAIAMSISVSAAHERAQYALYENPRRHLWRRRKDEEGRPVELRDWWVPHFYQQRPVLLQPTQIGHISKQPSQASPVHTLNEEMPLEPRYGFSGRARELLQIERALLGGRLVVISGFGGIGKTALVRETADWLTRTGMYERACFVSFEYGGDAALLLSTLGHILGVYDGHYIPNDAQAALAQLKPALKKMRTLVIADNLETILPGGEAPMDIEIRRQLWGVLLALAKMDAGVLLTSRDTSFGDERLARGSRVKHIRLKGLHPEDAYILATRVLADLEIDRALAPYESLCELLKQLDYHPLAIQLVLPTLREWPFTKVCTDFAEMLPNFVDNTLTGHNRSLLASLDYSLRQLSEEQRGLLLYLAQFEGGASEEALLNVTQIPKSKWIELRSALERAALLTIEPIHEVLRDVPFLHFHPVLIPFLRTLPGANDAGLRERYALAYFTLILFLNSHHQTHALPVRAQVRRELPNLLRALKLLLESGNLEYASEMVSLTAMFLEILGQWRERDELRRLVDSTAINVNVNERLPSTEYVREMYMGEEAFRKGDLSAASDRFARLLARIEKQPEGTFVGRGPQGQPQRVLVGRGEYEHCRTLLWLARCHLLEGRPHEAELRLLEALAVATTAHLKRKPDDQTFTNERGTLLSDLGTALREQGRYPEAWVAYKEALEIANQQRNIELLAIVLKQTGDLELVEGDYSAAQFFYNAAMPRFHALGQLSDEAATWNNLGIVAEKQKAWAEAERCYRESLAISMQLDDETKIAGTCNQLAAVAKNSGRPTEAEGWLKPSLELSERIYPGSPAHALYLNNLASVLLDQAEAGYASPARLAEAKDYAEQALAIKQTFDASSDIWTTLGILADIAKLGGRGEIAQEYYRREREAFANFSGNRYEIDKQYSSFIAGIVAVAKGDTRLRSKVDTALPLFEAKGWRITAAVHRIWMGERDWQLLVEELDRQSALLILRVLETLARSSDTQPVETGDRTQEQIIVSLPPTIREAFVNRDITAFRTAFAALSPEEQHTVAEAIHHLQVLGEEAVQVPVGKDMNDVVQKFEPLLQAIAAVAIGDAVPNGQIEEVLIDLEREGWHLKSAVQRIWGGERDEAVLKVGLDEQDATLVQRILGIIAGA